MSFSGGLVHQRKYTEMTRHQGGVMQKVGSCGYCYGCCAEEHGLGEGH